ncbi:MAG: hypothetical protein DRP79_01550 [Planctomycetota bacterium]|nr:MAG: hypothetical protein DRP79_01550 [Planctomycetota bacterium]
MDRPFQRKGARSNAHVGRDFGAKAKKFFARQGLNLTSCFEIGIGINGWKPHNIILGSDGVLCSYEM